MSWSLPSSNKKNHNKIFDIILTYKQWYGVWAVSMYNKFWIELKIWLCSACLPALNDNAFCHWHFMIDEVTVSTCLNLSLYLPKQQYRYYSYCQPWQKLNYSCTKKFFFFKYLLVPLILSHNNLHLHTPLIHYM